MPHRALTEARTGRAEIHARSPFLFPTITARISIPLGWCRLTQTPPPPPTIQRRMILIHITPCRPWSHHNKTHRCNSASSLFSWTTTSPWINLLKDMHLRKRMDSQGFVFLDVIVEFNRIKQLTDDRALIKAVCMQCENIEIRVGDDGKERLRRHADWERFVLPMVERDESAQTDGPQRVERVAEQRPHISTNMSPHFRPPGSGSFSAVTPRTDRRSYDGFSSMSALTPQFDPLLCFCRPSVVCRSAVAGRPPRPDAQACSQGSRSRTRRA